MTAATTSDSTTGRLSAPSIAADDQNHLAQPVPDSLVARMLGSGRVMIGGGIIVAIVLLSVLTLPWTLNRQSSLYFNRQNADLARAAPTSSSVAGWFGYDALGRSILARCLLGGTISLAVGAAAATIAVLLGVSVGLIAGYKGGAVDSALMRLVDVLYGLPYILLVILFKIAFEPKLAQVLSAQAANLVVLFSAIGLVSWLTMSRVVRGQVLSLRGQPFVEAARAMGLPSRRIFLRHILPNLIGPITVYATLTVPQAILQESFLSFLGIGITPPMPTWGSLASDAVTTLSPVRFYWWMLIFPCTLLVVTLLSLNFVGDGLRDIFDPKREAAKL
ncbi:ABC transporter permease [Fontivita pretiosa]|uniref:ABC transporter permease n=1 Tax=Fontivita pretiosa TaxID=2989684 RepID=UPI003D163C64